MTRLRHALPLRSISALLAAGLAACLLVGCGSDDGDRGLTPAGEVAVPDSLAENAMTEEERAKARIEKEQGTAAEQFEEAQEH